MTEMLILFRILLTACQVLLWNKPIKSLWNQSVQLYTKNRLEISMDFGAKSMPQYVVSKQYDVSVIQTPWHNKLHQ